MPNNFPAAARIFEVTTSISPEALEKRLEEKELGIFETFLVKKSFKDNQSTHSSEVYVTGLDYHLERLIQASKDLNLLAVSPEQIINSLKLNIASLEPRVTYPVRVRLDLFCDSYYLTFTNYSPNFSFEKGVSLLTILAERENPMYKTNRTMVSIQARKSAELQGYDEALLLDSTGLVREGAWSNFFWVSKEGIIYTPSSGILKGVTRAIVLNAIRVNEADFNLAFIKDNIQSAFITQSTNGIVPVTKIDNLELKRNEIAAELLLYYEKKRTILV